MIRVWSDGQPAGVLDRLAPRGSAFAYDPKATPDQAVSVTMPVRISSWDTKFGLAPIFEMNLPEGALRERLTRLFAKATGTFDDFDLLGVVGRTQIGRVRYSAMDADLSEDVPFQSIDEILRARREGGLFDYLLETFAAHSGLSGVQPKVMIRAEPEYRNPKDQNGRLSQSLRSATHIVKLWEAEEYPDLAANEYFCLLAAKSIGLSVPNFQLSDDGAALVVERFDLVDGSYLGFEDFCVLNGFGTSDKYKGGYETRLFQRMREFVAPENHRRAAENLFKLFVLNCAIRNGDAHLKNFAIMYDDVNGMSDLAPVYDLVTTVAYLPRDGMALTLNGTTNWPDRRKLIQLGQTRLDLSLPKIEAIMESTADAMCDVAPKMREYFRSTEFEVGKRMGEAWETGIKDSLGFGESHLRCSKKPNKEQRKPRIANSDAMILEYLRNNDGKISGTQKVIACQIGIPPSTFSASVRRLAARELIRRRPRFMELIPREV